MRGEALTANRLRELLHYDPETGVFTRRVTTNYNACIGDVTGCTEFSGHLNIRIDGRRYKAHRLAWMYVEGEWPTHEIDHVNRVPADNRRSNLRLADDWQQAANHSRRRDNKSGFTGVFWHGRFKKFHANIKAGYRRLHLGSFDTARDAALAHDIAAAIIFGEFAYLNLPTELPRSVLLSDIRLTARAWRNIAKARQSFEYNLKG